jgi:hypothetical protein
MGWDYQHVDKGTKTADIELPRFSPGWEVLDHAQVGSTFYVVCWTCCRSLRTSGLPSG